MTAINALLFVLFQAAARFSSYCYRFSKEKHRFWTITYLKSSISFEIKAYFFLLTQPPYIYKWTSCFANWQVVTRAFHLVSGRFSARSFRFNVSVSVVVKNYLSCLCGGRMISACQLENAANRLINNNVVYRNNRLPLIHMERFVCGGKSYSSF